MARAITKLEPAEKGRTKDKKPNSRSQRWKRWERSVCRTMLEWDGPNETFTKMRLTTSCGRIGHIVELGFDGVSKHYAIECKQVTTLPKYLQGWWGQVCQIARTYKLHPLLAIDQPDVTFTYEDHTEKLPPMHIITAERHAQLLAYEKRCEMLDSQVEEQP